MTDDDAISVWWKPADDRGPACLSIRVVGGPKAYRRIWSPGTDDEAIDWGWTLASTAIELSP
jgi:hypothetical protein